MDLSIVISCYNEEDKISNTVEVIAKFCKWYCKKFEIIVIDDGSTDDTRYRARVNENVKVFRNRRNRGKGYSIRKGMLAAKGKYVFYTDADLSIPINILSFLMLDIDRYDIVIGSKYIKGAEIIHKRELRHIMGRGFAFITRLLLNLHYRDSQCGFKLFNKDVVKSLFNKQTIEGYSFDSEILLIAQKKQYCVREVPITCYDSQNKLTIRADALKMLIQLLKIKYNDVRGKYG